MSMIMRTLGLIVAAAFVAAGIAVAAALLPLLIGLAAMAAFAALCLRQEKPEVATTWFARTPVRLAVGVAGGAIVAVYAAIGMTTVLGGAATALAGATALAVLGYRRLRPRLAGDTEHATGNRPGLAEVAPSPDVRAPDAGAPDAAAPDAGAPDTGGPDTAGADTGGRALIPDDPEALSTDDLCRAWRVSFLLLENARVATQLEHASVLRGRYLEELARRDPEGFRRWLDDGARAASDPSPYIRRRPGPPQRDERDEDKAA